MLKRKENYHPMEFEDLEDHEERYMDFKKDNLIRKKA